MAAVGSRIAGRVSRLYKIEGDELKAGDLLAEIESADLGQAQAAVIAARAEGAGEAAHRRDQIIVLDVRRKHLQILELAGVGTNLLMFLRPDGGAGGEKKSDRDGNGAHSHGCAT